MAFEPAPFVSAATLQCVRRREPHVRGKNLVMRTCSSDFVYIDIRNVSLYSVKIVRSG